MLESQHGVSVLTKLSAAVTAATNRNLWSLAHKEMASRYWTSWIAYWMMVSFAPTLQLSKSAPSFSQSLSAIHTPIAANRERYLAAVLRSIVPPRKHAQSLTQGKQQGALLKKDPPWKQHQDCKTTQLQQVTEQWHTAKPISVPFLGLKILDGGSKSL